MEEIPAGFRNEHGLPQDLSQRVLSFIYQHRDDSDFWKPISGADDTGARSIIKLDAQGRTTRLLKAHRIDMEGPHNIYHEIVYEEWEYREETAIMIREEQTATGYNILIRRTFEKDVLVEDVQVTEYPDRGTVIIITKPINLLDGTTIYAMLTYYPAQNAEGTDGNAYPLPHIELFTMNVEIFVPEEHSSQLIDYLHNMDVLGLLKHFKQHGVTYSIPIAEIPATTQVDQITTTNTELTIETNYGKVTFPRQLNLEQLFQSLQFESV
jgi:hypothetical protein